jgi:hypothetical protein
LGFIGVAVAFSFAPARMLASRPAGVGPFDALRFRDIGPAATGGRIHDLQIDPKNPPSCTSAAARRHLEVDNKGVTWTRHVRQQPTTRSARWRSSRATPRSSGPAPARQNNRQSSSWGGGVYRSTDGGETWTYLGLHDTRSIGRVVLDPVDPNVAYIAASAILGGNPERGVFKTTDAGRTWNKVLFVDTSPARRIS